MGRGLPGKIEIFSWVLPGCPHFFSCLRAQNFPTVLFFLRRKKCLNKISGAKNVNSIFLIWLTLLTLGPNAKFKSLPSLDFVCKKNVLKKKPQKIKGVQSE